jgi:hypothetical protein
MKHSEQSFSHRGPSLLALAIVYTLLVAAAVVSGLLLKHGALVVSPEASAEEARRFFSNNPVSLRVAAFFSFGSSVPLGIYTATVVSRLRFLGVRAAGSYIALFGGFAASAALVISALCAWVLSVPEVATSLAATRVLDLLTLLFGGVSFAVAFGLLAAGVSVTSHFFHLLPRWLVWFGIITAVVGELSSLSLLALWATPLIPLVRFASFVWLIAVGATLPNTIRTTAVPAGDLIGETDSGRDAEAA